VKQRHAFEEHRENKMKNRSDHQSTTNKLGLIGSLLAIASLGGANVASAQTSALSPSTNQTPQGGARPEVASNTLIERPKCSSITAATLALRQACAQAERDFSAKMLQSMMSGNVPVDANPAGMTDQQRQAALDKAGIQKNQPTSSGAVITKAQAEAAKKDPQAALKAQQAASEALPGKDNPLKEMPASQVQSLINASRQQITLMADAPSGAALKALFNAGKAGAKVQIITHAQNLAALKKALPKASFIVIPGSGAMQGIAVIDSKVMVMGSFQDPSRYSATTSKVVVKNTQQALNDLILTQAKGNVQSDPSTSVPAASAPGTASTATPATGSSDPRRPPPTPGSGETAPPIPDHDRTAPVQGLKHNRLAFNNGVVEVEPGSFINNACLVTWPGPNPSSDYSVPMAVGRVDPGLTLTLGRAYARPGSCNDPLVAISASAQVGSTLSAEVIDPTDASNRAVLMVHVVPRGTLKLEFDPMNPEFQAVKTQAQRQTHPWTVAFSPSNLVGRPGETVTVPIVVSGMGVTADGKSEEGATLVFDQLMPPGLSFKMFSSQYQKSFDSGVKDINAQLYPVYRGSVQALAITIPKDARPASYDIQVSLTNNVFDTTATLHLKVDPNGQSNGLKDPATWLLGPLDPLTNMVTTTAPGQRCGVTAGRMTNYTIFRPSETCGIQQIVLMRARSPKNSNIHPGELVQDPDFYWTLQRDSNAEEGYTKLTTLTTYDYEFSLDDGKTWTTAQRPR